ncbi:TauD/TfdA family dioxygenase [Moorena producens]|uniref:TauD/TfdA family dioxygenase n=1 Tax=Moorena producens TaxID=1155739 RepID=UPI003C74D032
MVSQTVTSKFQEDAKNLVNLPAAWKGNELLNSTYWNYRLTSTEIAEIEAAIDALKISNDQAIEFNQLSKTLGGVSEELENGKGAVLLKGIPVNRYSEEEIAQVYLLLCRQMGLPVRESNSDFNSPIRKTTQFITYIRAEAPDSSEKDKQSNDAFRFHCDRCDINSLLCIRQARTGGENRLASAITIYNEMRQSHPDIAQELFKEIPFFFEGENNWTGYPLWCIHKGKFTTQYSSAYVKLSQLVPGAPRLTEKQKQGLELLEEIGLKVGMTLRVEPGDWLITNNHVIYHARSSWPIESGEYDRLLLRVWYTPFNSRELPDIPSFKTMWGAVEAGQPRGGFLPNHPTPLDQPITEPLSETDAYWLAQYMKGRWRGVDHIK